MRLIFVRHGEPDYAHDCLTPEGHRQAAAAARRLSGEGITEIYASPQGRAQETAGYTASLLGLPVTTLEYMHEIRWGGPDIPENGHPWTLGSRMTAEENFDYSTRSWREHPYFRENAATECYDMISGAFDRFMTDKGYIHDGRHFICRAEKEETIALFSHGGSGACVLAHLLSLPFPYVAAVMPYDFTSVIILNFPFSPGSHVFPRVELFNDTAHIHAPAGPQFQQKPD